MAQHEGTFAIADEKSLVTIHCSSVMSYFTLHIKVHLYCCHTLAMQRMLLETADIATCGMEIVIIHMFSIKFKGKRTKV